MQPFVYLEAELTTSGDAGCSAVLSAVERQGSKMASDMRDYKYGYFVLSGYSSLKKAYYLSNIGDRYGLFRMVMKTLN